MGTVCSPAVAFDPRLSASLCNEILRRGWDGATHRLGLPFEESTGKWWDTYGLECNATGVAGRLAPDLVDFHSARVIHPELESQANPLFGNFFYYLMAIALPEDFFGLPSLFVEEPDPNRYLLLCHAADVMSHPLGLIEVILERTVTAFRSLLKAIEERMPQSTGMASATRNKRTIFDIAQLAEKLVTSEQVSGNNFVVKILREIDRSIKSTVPSLQFIAPDLRIPGVHLMDQLFEGDRSDGTILLATFPDGIWNPFPSPYTRPASGFSSGVWIAENKFESPAFDDTCRLLLSDHFLARAQHYAKSTDGFLLKQSMNQGEGLSAAVPGFRALDPNDWNGTWTVDEHGVTGGMEKWAEADQSNDMAEKYRLQYMC
ncbi:uncharacterized protein JN550_001671 [Neoarthrinium moseri]|uniref:uncharacterized protein n=1 Tax=Neoarthrinium moseri TaxID=1658444 RepID=UPI001FDB6A52|nr:uncharacterized protein JN550_001671 [Neoarthrinium moseri]KAI1876175.1 hypothetical protein JN550_001671 [Neoarthrinium moseri]